MTNNRHPQGWTILKFTTQDKVFFRIFATWRWENQKWMLSSGASTTERVIRENNQYIWPQASGSVYHLPMDGENCCTAYQGHVLENILVQTAAEGVIVEIVNLASLLGEPQLTNQQYLI